MRVVSYTAAHFDALATAVAASAAGAGKSLAHRPFVDYYYTTRDSCRLLLALADDGTVAAAVGVEQVPFAYEGRPLTIGCASNFVAFRPGAGGVLFLAWVRASTVACIYGGSPDTHRILENQRWTYFPGVRVYRLNPRCVARAAEPRWRSAARIVAHAVRLRVDVADRLRQAVGRGELPVVAAEEVDAIGDEMVAAHGPFAFRLAPTAEYLAWRYRPGLSFVRYRLFRLHAGRTCGYVVLNERRDEVMVAQADATEPRVLVAGILAAVARLAEEDGGRREVVLTAAHEEMQRAFVACGFRPANVERPFALGTARGGVDFDRDTTRWLVNFDWTDNGLRPPFLDQEIAEPSPAGDAGLVHAWRHAPSSSAS